MKRQAAGHGMGVAAPVRIGDTVADPMENFLGTVDAIRPGGLYLVNGTWHRRSELLPLPGAAEIERRKLETPTGQLAASLRGRDLE